MNIMIAAIGGSSGAGTAACRIEAAANPMPAAQCCNYCQSPHGQMLSAGMRDWEYGVEGHYSWWACHNCGAVQLDPFPDQEALKQAYAIDYHGYATGQKRGPLFALLYAAKEALFRRQMSKLVGPGARALDVGCGAGEFLQSLRGLGVTQLEGIDFSQDMVDALQAQGMRGFCGTFPQFQGEAESYDLISMNNYLEHTIDPAAELGKALELLCPGAHLVGEVPGFDSWERRLAGRFWGGNHVPRHTYQFSGDFLAKQLAEAGFERVHISHQLNTSHWALSVQNYLQRNVPDLRHNPAITHGRSRYYVLLLLLFIPINVLAVLCRKSGCIKFSARKPVAASGDSHV